ncbi:GNAT family N-acetyltransferase [Streptomyces violaceusniger]|uniref:GNAT family N-acetyltransferase n=1 Tax=Streptomyces violaceusniger TaxID=68280 RepID=UPI00380D0321
MGVERGGAYGVGSRTCPPRSTPHPPRRDGIRPRVGGRRLPCRGRLDHSGSGPRSRFAVIGPLATELAGDRAAAMESAQEALAPHRPKDPVWFLATVGVDPRARDRSLGTAVIRPGLEGAERAGVPVFLETSEADSVRFYERLGFAVTAEVALPGGGPRTWCMLREPQAPGRQRVAIGQSAGRLRETKYPLRAAARPGRGFEEHL